MRQLLAATIVLSFSVATAHAEVAPEVTIESGILRGVIEEGVSSWKGIPYAAPPVGASRWRAPQPAQPWTGVRTAVNYANDCMQIPVNSDAAPLGTAPSEDCLYANVWRPAEASGKLPVVVWIYGGGFINGGSSPAMYSGANLARKGVLVVSFNYRLGRFGTFVHPQLTAEVGNAEPLGNYGVLDQIAALDWVKKNIEAFGGDPSNVTVMGESAGGISVHMLVTSPLSQGLFAKAVIMSGSNGQRTSTATFAEIEGLGTVFSEQHGIAADDPQALSKLRSLTAQEIAGDLNMSSMGSHRPVTWVGPFVDGRAVVDAGEAYASGRFNRVPMITGATDEDFDGRVGSMVGGARRISNTLAAAGLPIYQYRLSYVATSMAEENRGALHATDIPFFLHTQATRYGEDTTDTDNAVGNLISDYVVQFAHTGDPNGEGRAPWPPYQAPDGILLDFRRDGSAVAGTDPWGQEIDAAPDVGFPDFIANAR